jgi:polysaccharide pyruvyl transferase WcaK-like protein
MRILVATGLNRGPAEYRNLGDVAMLQVAVNRLLALWPNSEVQVLTDSPEDLARHCPGARAVSRAGGRCLVDNGVILGRLHRLLPQRLSSLASAWKRRIGLASPSLLESIIGLRLKFRDTGRREKFQAFLFALKNADLLVVCGSGGFADSCREWNLSTMGMMEAAMRRDVPVVMFGQGIGPLHDAATLAWARQVLPKVQLITLRGTEGGTQLLQSLGVAAENAQLTGDETVELAYKARAAQAGDAIGINLRVATYSDVTNDVLDQLRAVLQQQARVHNAPLAAIPIALHEYADDAATIRRLLAGLDDNSDGGLSLDTPLKVIRQIGNCRVVVTGAYHAAVFALAQGVPAVCLAKNDYYRSKFSGLSKAFGAGCTIVDLNQDEFARDLATAIDLQWDAADTVRPTLLAAAVRQLERSRAAYQTVKDSFESESGSVCGKASYLQLRASTIR